MKRIITMRTKASSSEEGFTLIELMIVVVIIGILAAIAIPIFATQQKAAINAHTKSSVRELRNAIEIARVKTSKPLIGITFNSCTGCLWAAGSDPLTTDKSSVAWTRYNLALDRISKASGVDVTGLLDGYGRPLYIDENETEFAGACTKDVIGSMTDPFAGYGSRENEIKLSFYTACAN